MGKNKKWQTLELDYSPEAPHILLIPEEIGTDESTLGFENSLLELDRVGADLEELHLHGEGGASCGKGPSHSKTHATSLSLDSVHGTRSQADTATGTNPSLNDAHRTGSRRTKSTTQNTVNPKRLWKKNKAVNISALGSFKPRRRPVNDSMWQTLKKPSDVETERTSTKRVIHSTKTTVIPASTNAPSQTIIPAEYLPCLAQPTLPESSPAFGTSNPAISPGIQPHPDWQHWTQDAQPYQGLFPCTGPIDPYAAMSSHEQPLEMNQFGPSFTPFSNPASLQGHSNGLGWSDGQAMSTPAAEQDPHSYLASQSQSMLYAWMPWPQQSRGMYQSTRNSMVSSHSAYWPCYSNEFYSSHAPESSESPACTTFCMPNGYQSQQYSTVPMESQTSWAISDSACNIPQEDQALQYQSDQGQAQVPVEHLDAVMHEPPPLPMVSRPPCQEPQEYTHDARESQTSPAPLFRRSLTLTPQSDQNVGESQIALTPLNRRCSEPDLHFKAQSLRRTQSAPHLPDP